MTPTITSELFAEIARLNILLNEREREISTLNQIIVELLKKGNVDEFGRTLPLDGHYESCLHGRYGCGWSYCSCEEIGKIEAQKAEVEDLEE